ncbi:radical SAM protein [Ruminococcus sp.]|uniref:radical SAM protein n=1 Tax=Ruminococcus sp. TaxID=41978 RepID=UPI003FD8A848
MHFTKVKGILSTKNGMNLYRGCSHGCIYCDSRSACYNMQHDFEDIEIKENAVELLEEALKRKRRRCMIGMGSMCDPYMPIEMTVQLTLKSLLLIEKYGFGATLITKSDKVLRDIDIIDRINRKSKAVTAMTLTTADENLCKLIEPNVCTTKRRYEVLKEFQRRGIPTVVWLTPILPFINDTEENLRQILDMCFDAGVKGIICFDFGVTLRKGDREYFYSKLDEHFPKLKDKYINTYGNSYICSSPNNKRLMDIFTAECKSHGVMYKPEDIFEYINEFQEKDGQTSLFDSGD